MTASVPDESLDPRLFTRARGALLGLVVGNQLGVPTERLGTAKAIREAFPQGVRDLAPPPNGSPFDDDAAMTLLLAESLVETGDFDATDVAGRWVTWMKRDGRGIGLTTQRALRLIEGGTEPFEAGRLAHNPRAASNGAVMRCIPVALRYHDNVDKMVRVSTQQAAITHADERCTWGAAAVNLAARELLHANQHFVEEVLHRLQGAPRALVEAIRRVPWEQESELPISGGGEAGYVVHRPSRTRSSFSPRQVATPTPTPPSRAHCSARGTAKRASRRVGLNSWGEGLRAAYRNWRRD